MDPVLHQAYLATTYQAETESGLVHVRIGHTSAKLDGILKCRGLQEWLFITAWNPASQKLSDDENERRHQNLVSRITELGLTAYAGWGVPDEANWEPEKSLLVLGIDTNLAGDLCAQYGQNAVVMGLYGQQARLVYYRAFRRPSR